jgi:hypothetical protein
LKQRAHSNKIPQQITCDKSADDSAAVARDGDDFVKVLDLQAVVEGVTNAMGGMEERQGAKNEEVEAHERKREKSRGGGELGGFGEAEGSGDSENEEMDGDQECGDDTSGAEEEPQERLDAEFGGMRLSVHLAFYPFVHWNPSGYVEFLVETHPASKKQIPHPAKSAGIRDDSRVEMWEANKVK